METRKRSELVLATALPTAPASAGKARTAVVRAFAGLPDEILDDAQLLVSEAVSDVVTTSGQAPDEPIRLSGYVAGTTLRVEVEQEGRRRVVEATERHLGHSILDQVATRWGHDHHDGSSVTWFELDAPPA